jgi:hypothetical protein
VPAGALDRVRVGRQFVYVPQTFHLDGVSVESARWNGISLRGLAGAPVHLYEGRRHGDVIAGGGIGFEPWRWVRIGGDYVHIEDEIFAVTDERDDLYVASADLRAGTHTLLGGRASWVESQFRRADANVRSRWEDGGLSGGIRAAYQPETLRDFTMDISPFTTVLLEYRSYYQVLAFIEKEIGPQASLEAGGGRRELHDEDDEGTYNHEFSRAYATLHLMDLPMKTLSTSVTGETWLTDSDDIYSAGWDVLWRPAGRWKAGAGYFYALFKIDRLTLEERERVHTVHGRVDGPILPWLGFLVSYEVEWDEGPPYQVVETGLKAGF